MTIANRDYPIANKKDYHDLPRQVSKSEKWEPWIAYILGAIQETVAFTRERILAILDLMLETMHMFSGGFHHCLECFVLVGISAKPSARVYEPVARKARRCRWFRETE